MNSTQLQTTLASLVALVAGYLAGRGIFGLDTNTWISILTAIVGVGGTLWAAFVTRKSAIVTTTANLPEVESVTLNRSADSNSLSAVTPDNVNVK